MIDVTGIVVFVGPNGSGKSLAAVASTLSALDGMSWSCIDYDHRHHDAFRRHLAGGCDPEHLAAGRLGCGQQLHLFRRAKGVADLAGKLCPDGLAILERDSAGDRLVYSTVVLVDDMGQDHPRFRGLTDYQQLLRLEHCDVLFDEVAGVSDSSESSAVPVQVVNWLHQLRKRDVRLRVTTPAYSRCSKPIRQVAQVVVDARSYFPDRRESGRLWRPRRGFMFVAYDAFAFEDFTSSTVRAEDRKGRMDRKSRVGRAAMWRPGSRPERTYNTLGQVLALGHVTETGMCVICGGNRPRPKCDGHDGIDPSEPFEVVERTTPSGVRIRSAIPAS
jgi:hypothetical protein